MKHLMKALALILSAVMTVSLVACASGTSESAASTADSTPGESPAADSPAPVDAGNKATLVYWDMYYGPEQTYGPAVKKVIDQYNSEDHAAVIDIQMLGWDGFYEVFQTAVNSGSAPDISTGAYPGPVQYAAMGEALDLTPIVDKWKAENNPILDDFLTGALELHVYEGKQVAIPFNADPRGIFYRADILEDELGFTDLDKEVSWEKLLEICQAVKDKYGDEGVFAMGFPILNAGSMHTMINFLLSNGTGWANPTGTGPNYDDPKCLETMQFIGQMYENGYFPDGIASYASADVQKLYSAEKLVMVWQEPPAFLFDNEDLMNRTKVMGPIRGTSADSQLHLTSWMNGVMGYSQTDHPDAVLEFLEWLPQNNLSVFLEGGSNALPVRKSFYEDDYYKNDYMRSQYCRNMEYYTNPVWPSPVCFPAFGQIEGENSIGKPLEALLMGSSDYQADLLSANDMMQKDFDNLN